MTILKRIDGEIIAEDTKKTLRQLCKENRSDLRGSDLRWSDLRGSNLRGSNLRWSDLRWSDLSWSDLRGSDLRGSDLRWSDLRGSDLRGSDLRWSDLRWSDLSRSDLSRSDLRWSDLRGSDLRGSDLRWSDLRGSNIEFYQFPSIRLLSSMPLGELTAPLAIELMRRDAWAHPHPERFEAWSKGGPCPYQDEEYFWSFDYESAKRFWNPGPPEMRDSDLIIAICKEKRWKIKGY